MGSGGEEEIDDGERGATEKWQRRDDPAVVKKKLSAQGSGADRKESFGSERVKSQGKKRPQER